MSFKEFCIENCIKLDDSFNVTACSESDYVACYMNPDKILDLEYLVPVTILLSCIFFTGLVGNLCVCVVIARHPTLRSETNAYLFSLAISDLLLLVFGLPPELWYYWHMFPYTFGEFMCRFNPFMAATGTFSSVLTVVAFSVERYEAICHPLRTRTRGGKRVAIALCVAWAIGLGTAMPILHVYHIVKSIPYPPFSDTDSTTGSDLSATCIIPKDPEYAYYDYFYVYSSVLFFFIPMAVLLLAYTKIALFMRKNLQLSRNCGIQNSCSENRRTFKMLVAVVLAFFICGAPYHYQRLFTSSEATDEKSKEQKQYETNVYVATSVFYYFSATINPLLYNAMSKKYRKAFVDVFWTKSGSKENTMAMKTMKIYTKSTTTQTLIH